MTRRRLSDQTLGALPQGIATPDYDRQRKGIGIVHLGVGAFHKAHQAVYTDTAMAKSGGDWMIAGVSLRSRTTRDQLAPQNGLFSVLEQGTSGIKVRVVGSIGKVLVAPEDPAGVVDLMAHPDVHIITLTITEKGYCLAPADGLIDFEHPDIVHDIEHPADPVSAIGFLVAAISRRYHMDAPLTVISCDNLASNGQKLGQAVRAFIERTSPESLDWFDQNVRFPGTMVDRIVPATSSDVRRRISACLVVTDEACVATEGFSQWIIEDMFATPAPDWTSAGALLVNDVEPYERMKLRLLNAAHSAVAYLGMVGGIPFVHEAMEMPVFHRFIEHMMRGEIRHVVEVPGAFDLDLYITQLLSRFANAALRHETEQIAMDGSQKLPQRILPSIRALRARSLPHNALTLSIAGWIQYLSGMDLNGRHIEVIDPACSQLRERLKASSTTRRDVEAILSFEPVFGADLASDAGFADSVVDVLERLRQQGLSETLEQMPGLHKPATPQER